MAYDSTANFRFRIAKDIFRLLLAPPLVLAACAHILHLRLGWWSPVAYLLAIIIAATIRTQYTDYSHRREAAQLGARPIPCVVGKWPGNIDIMLKLKNGLTEGYMYQAYLELFEEYQCTTLNTRILWSDHVSVCLLAPRLSKYLI